VGWSKIDHGPPRKWLVQGGMKQGLREVVTDKGYHTRRGFLAEIERAWFGTYVSVSQTTQAQLGRQRGKQQSGGCTPTRRRVGRRAGQEKLIAKRRGELLEASLRASI